MPVDYFLLVERRDPCWEHYGICQRITVSRAGILSLLSKLMQGGVTPVAARYVVEDWLLE